MHRCECSGTSLSSSLLICAAPQTDVSPSGGQFIHSFKLKPEKTGVNVVWSGPVPTSTRALPTLSFKPLGIRLTWTDTSRTKHHHQLPQDAAVVQHLRNHVRLHRDKWQAVVTLEQATLPLLAPYEKELGNFQIEVRMTVIHKAIDQYLLAEPGEGGTQLPVGRPVTATL